MNRDHKHSTTTPYTSIFWKSYASSKYSHSGEWRVAFYLPIITSTY